MTPAICIITERFVEGGIVLFLPVQVQRAYPLKRGKTAGVDNIPKELVHTGGEDVIVVFMTICN